MVAKAPRNYAVRKAAALRAQEQLDSLPWETVGGGITKEWAAADTLERREALWHELRGLARVRERLRSAVSDGVSAQREEAEANKPSKAQSRADIRQEHMAKMGIQ